ncbi:uncharacterized protein LOC135690325 isoform X1 [Rhopilema esculentum]|uniref:uncharacterized protein LOC135690325 isoform X1 n=1 Tax=Rhopilema esculentum TaxID=499914 RepID=UPI0031CEB966
MSEVQGYHWNQKQCTLHPVVIYYKENNGVIGSTSLCFLSDDLEHDVHFVYNVLKATAHHIREMISMDIKVVHYFSDGCAGQYKNCKNFLNLCHHKEDFTISCEWNFFATSHGKSPCDGIRGTVKRLAAQVSLQRPMKNQIISVEALFQFCKTEVKGINFYYITKEENNLTRKDLEKRLTAAKTIPGTRGFHQFVPQSKALIGAKTISETPEFDVKFDFNLAVIEPHDDIEIGDYLVCRYDTHCWVGVTIEVSSENKDVAIKFLHPHLPCVSFMWPRRGDVRWVPTSNILKKVQPPKPSTMTGRQYTFEPKDALEIEL